MENLWSSEVHWKDCCYNFDNAAYENKTSQHCNDYIEKYMY